MNVLRAAADALIETAFGEADSEPGAGVGVGVGVARGRRQWAWASQWGSAWASACVGSGVGVGLVPTCTFPAVVVLPLIVTVIVNDGMLVPS